MGSRARAVSLALASLLISFLLSLGVLELALRGYHHVKVWRERRALPPPERLAVIPSPDPVLEFEWNPGYRKDGFTVNSLGMADREVTLEKPAGVFRIAVIGDSISANFGHRPRDEIYWSVLARRLAREARGTEVLNFAVNGYGVLQSLRMLETRALRFSPDLVIAQLCLNDPYATANPFSQTAPSGPSRLWNFVFRRLSPDHFWAWSYVGYGYDETGIEHVRRGIAGLAQIARAGPPILAVLFPYLYAPAYDEWGFARYHEIYRRAAQEAGLPLLDLYEPFRRSNEIAARAHPADPIHPSREAHELAAAEILTRLDALGMLPGGKLESGG
jgi:lysophospholipase L1-like esterase